MKFNIKLKGNFSTFSGGRYGIKFVDGEAITDKVVLANKLASRGMRVTVVEEEPEVKAKVNSRKK